MISKPSNIFLRLILLFNIFYMCCFKDNKPMPVSSTLLLEEDNLIALKCYQPEFGAWSHKSQNDGSINDVANHYYVRKGLFGDYSISLESKVNKGFYWRVKNGLLKLEKDDGSKLFKEESSFIPVPGIKNINLLSLIPVKYPGHYVRHQNGIIKISPKASDDVFLCDSTWYVHSI